MANNRELSQLASFVTVNDTSKTIAFGSTVASLNVAGVVTATSFDGPTNAVNVNVSGVGTITRLEATNINVSGVSTVGLITALPFSGSNIAIGTDAGLRTGGLDNVSIGASASLNMTTGEHNTFIGCVSGVNNTTGSYNIAIGLSAGYNLQSGSSNVFLGRGAGFSATTGANNFIAGFNAGFALTASNTIIIGTSAGRCKTDGNANTFIGLVAAGGTFTSAGNNNHIFGCCAGYHLNGGCRNTFLGGRAGQGSAASGGITACDNVAVGLQAMLSLSSGNSNVAIGECAGRDITSGGSNTFLGYRAGLGASTGGNNIALGFNSGNDAVFGHAGVGATSNVIVMGNNSHTKSYIKIDWTVTSDERDKNIIGKVPLGLEFVQGLEPIKFQFKNRESGEVTDDTLRYGFKAQQVAELEGEPNVIADVADPENLKVTSAHLVPVLVNAIKELSAKVAELEARLDAQ